MSAGAQLHQPLAERLRPRSLGEVIGQQHLIGEGLALRLAFESGQPHSCILWGPPGVGKTTIARLMADAFDAQFISISAVLGGVKDIRDAVEKAQAALEQRRLVERENHRKQDEYDEKLKAAQKRVRDLNNRFADWYYVVSDKEYAKIHLDRTSVVQKKEEKPADAPVQ